MSFAGVYEIYEAIIAIALIIAGILVAFDGPASRAWGALMVCWAFSYSSSGYPDFKQLAEQTTEQAGHVCAPILLCDSGRRVARWRPAVTALGGPRSPRSYCRGGHWPRGRRSYARR